MSAPRRQHSAIRRQRGFALVEFVLTAPVLLVLMFGSFEFGHYLLEYSTLNDAMDNAASWAATQALQGSAGVLVSGSAWNTLATQAQNMVVYGNAAGTGTPVLPSLNVGEITATENASNNTITLTATYPYISLFGAAIPTFMGGSISTTLTMNISTTMEAI
jgi:Flp pilus assembly protein TadG